MKRILGSVLVLGFYFTPVNVNVIAQHSEVQTQSQQEEVQRLVEQAWQQTQQGKPLEAIETLQQLLSIARQLEDKKSEATALLGIGLNFSNIGRPQQALNYYNQALLIFREVGDRNGEATILNNLGEAYRVTGQPQKALDYYNQALPILREKEVNNRSWAARTLNNIGSVYQSIGQPQKALDYYNQALPIFREVGDRLMEATTLNNTGEVYRSIGQPQKAIDYSNQALLIAREVQNRSGEATTLNNLGAIYQGIGQFQKALDYYNQALPILREVGNRLMEATTLNNLGLVYQSIGQPQKAIDYYNQALPISREVGDRSGEATTLNNLGAVYQGIGQPQKALEYYYQALPILREVGNRLMEATTLNNLGLVYQSTEQPQKALDYFSQALPINREVGDRSGEAIILSNIGVVYDSIGQFQKALDYYNQALPILREVGNRLMEATTLNNTGEVYRSIGQPQKALEYYNQALPILREVVYRSGEATTLSNLGLVYRDTNQPSEAIKNLEQSVTITLEMRRGLLRENRQAFVQAYNKAAIALTDLLLKQNQPEKAFEWINLATTADLADYNRLINARVANPQAQKAIDEWNQKNQQLEFLRQQVQENYSEDKARQMREFEAEVYKQAENIAKQFPEVAELFETQPTDITQLRQNIPANTVVIQPVPLTGVKNVLNTLALFILTKDKLTVIQKPLPDNFDTLVTDFHQQLASISAYTETGGQLYDLLIRPVEEQSLIPANFQIAIIATGKLRDIPFEALYDLQAEKYFLEKYPVSYLTRISTRSRIASTPSKQAISALAFANPRPTQEEMKGTEAEADYLIKNFPGSQDYRHEQATLDTFKTQAPRFSILHLGIHGCFDTKGCPKLGMKPNTILFANEQQYPIADAALLGLNNTELLVLAACETAKSTNDVSVGLAGLSYVWERAGAKSVIASLWNAPDEASSAIMIQFYENLKQGLSKAEAMRQAKLSQIEKHPYFWSPFILIGDAEKPFNSLEIGNRK